MMLRSRLRSAVQVAATPRRSVAALSTASAHAWEPIEAKWQKRWAAQQQQKPRAASASERDTFYCLAMFPYPSGSSARMRASLCIERAYFSL